MKPILLFMLVLLCTNVARAETYTQFQYFVYGLWYCVTGLFTDIFYKHPPTPLDAFKTIPEIILTAGYRFETHKIVTPDNYINTAWRIVGRLDEVEDPHPERKPCVILQHGLLDNSATWLMLDHTVALPFMLVDQGYDVWLVNSRGNINSYEHMDIVNYNFHKSDSDYFRFTWDDMAKYDVPTNINYALKHSNYKKVFYVGHSQGTTSFFAAADIVPDLADKVEVFVALAPVMYVGNIVSPFIWILAKSPLPTLLGWMKQYNFLILPEYFSPTFRWVGEKLRTFVWRIIGLICGIDEKIRSDLSRMPVLLHNEPGGTSYFNMLHWIQSIFANEFIMFDYGSAQENMKHYNRTEPPLYNTTNIRETLTKIPTILFVGENDALVAPKDFEKLANLVNGTGTEIVKIDHYAHVDYVWGLDSKQLVFDPTVQFIKDHTTLNSD